MTQQIFEQSVGVILDIRLWSGSKKLKDEDFAGIELPPEELVSLGSKRIHNREALKPLQAIRTKAVSLMESAAVSLYGGKVWLLPEDSLGDIETALAELSCEFDAARNHLLENFNAQQQAWLEQNSRWASILEPYLETPGSVQSKFCFSWRVFKISPAGCNDLADSVSGDMTSALFKEISTLAAEAYETLKDRDRATPKNLQRIDRLASKLRGLSFVDPGVGVIERELSAILESRDADGVLVGPSVYDMARLLVQLKTPSVLEEILHAVHNGRQFQFAYDAVQPRDEDIASPQEAPIPQPRNQPRLPDAWF